MLFIKDNKYIHIKPNFEKQETKTNGMFSIELWRFRHLISTKKMIALKI